MCPGKLPKQSIPQLPPLLLCYTNDVWNGTPVPAVGHHVNRGDRHPHHRECRPWSRPSRIQQYVSKPFSLCVCACVSEGVGGWLGGCVGGLVGEWVRAWKEWVGGSVSQSVSQSMSAWVRAWEEWVGGWVPEWVCACGVRDRVCVSCYAVNVLRHVAYSLISVKKSFSWRRVHKVV